MFFDRFVLDGGTGKRKYAQTNQQSAAEYVLQLGDVGCNDAKAQAIASQLLKSLAYRFKSCSTTPLPALRWAGII